MKRAPQMRGTLHPAVVAVLLVVFSASGLAAGTFAHGMIVTPTRDSGLSSTATIPSAPSASATDATPTATDMPTVVPSARFTLSASATPRSLRVGESFVVMVTAAAASGTPVAGLECFLRAPSDGSQPLYTQWPLPKVTDPLGSASWVLTAPSVAPGTYEIEAVAYGTGGYSYHWDLAVTITA